jgi:3',5'-cyclic AMP phosphodiesterase CpdA
MPVRLFHASDLHFGKEDRAALDWFAARVADERPDAVLITGDLTMRARAREFGAAQDWLQSLPAPVSVEVGNHDLPYFNPWGRFVAPYARYDRLERMIERPLSLDGVSVVPMRTTSRAQWRANWSHGIVRSGRITAAAEQVRAVPDGHVRIVTCHHPLTASDGGLTEGKTRGGQKALAALAEAGCDAVLSGHVHDPFDLLWPGSERPLRLIGAGTLSERIRTTPPSFNEIVVDKRQIGVTVRVMG